MDAKVDKAIEIAAIAHDNQYRKFEEACVPYIVHPLRVAARFSLCDNIHKIVAILHDVVEDTPVTLKDLEEHFSAEVIAAVDAISKRDGEKYFDYIERCKQNMVARSVKIVDIHDNMKSFTEGHGMFERYKKSLKILEQPTCF